MANEQYYTRPEWPAGTKIVNLVPQHSLGEKLDPGTVVDAINRGRLPIFDKFDGVPYEIPPGPFRAPYGAVRHFQARSVVPGSRNTENGKQESFIAIPGLDKPERCHPFTDHDFARFEGKVEAIDRESLSLPSDRDVTVIETKGERGFSSIGPGRMRPQQSAFVPNIGEVDRHEVMQAPDRAHNDAIQEMAADEAGLATDQAAHAEEVALRAKEHARNLKEKAK